MGNHDRERQTHYELEILDDLVVNNLNSGCSGSLFTKENLEQWQGIARTQQEIIKKKLVCVAFSLNKEKKIRCYIQNHQSRLCYLTDSLVNHYMQDTKNGIREEEEYFKTIEIVFEILLDLMQFLSSQFGEYFNFNEKATVSLKLEKFYLFRERITNLGNLVPDRNSELLRICLSPVNEFLDGKTDSQITFRELIYFDTLLKEIETIAQSGKPFEDSLKFTLICLNFNSFQFFRYLTNEIEIALKQDESHSAKVNRLSWYLKNYNQIIEKPDLFFKTRQASIKTQINNWIIEEIGYLEKSLQLAKASTVITSCYTSPDFKIHTELSVAQIGYFIRLLFDTGVLQNKNHSDVIKFISNNTKTRQVEIISPESLRTKFYNIEEGTRKTVKEIIIRILNQINQQS
jgi:hypothetical protein